MLMALFPRSVIRLVLVVVLSVASPSKAAVTVPKWQSVVPDTNHVIPLFGNLSQHSYPHAHAHAHAHTVWTLESLDRVYTNLTAHVPGDLISDLMNNGLVDDPYFNRNFLIQRDVWMGPYPSNSKYNSNCNSTNYEHDEHSKRQRTRTWKYTTHFSLPTTHSTTNLSWKLVLESVKMGAVVAVNGVTIGTVQDQFLRYILTIDDSVLQLSSSPSSSSSSSWKNGLRQHELTMTFDPGTSIHLHGRFMACSGGWDWAPYAQQVDGDGISMFTFGIIQPVYLVGVRHQYITDVVPKIYYQATTTVTYPNKPLRNGPQADFLLQVFVHMEHVQGTNTVGGGPLTNRSLVLRTDFGDQVQVVVPSQPPSSDYSTVQILNVTVPKHLVNLWWPNGMGDQPLYPIVLGFEQQQQQQHDNNSIPSTGSNSFSWEIQKRVGKCSRL
jgi:beta-mannosidase